jgi:hypothetical protein
MAGPRAAVDRFLVLNAAGSLAMAEGRALVDDELDGADDPTWGPLSTPDKLVMPNATTAVARLPAEGDRPDIYLYLHRSGAGEWAIGAMRTLALTGILHEVRRELRAKPTLTAEERDSLDEVELTLSSDRQLAGWFTANKASLAELKTMAEASGGSGWRRVETHQAKRRLAQLHATMLSIDDKGAIIVTLGGVIDNSVGFLFAPNTASLPPINSSEYIWIEPMGDGWYLFKTT